MLLLVSKCKVTGESESVSTETSKAYMWANSRVAGTMVACLSSVQVIACSNLSQVPPLLMHVWM